MRGVIGIIALSIACVGVAFAEPARKDPGVLEKLIRKGDWKRYQNRVLLFQSSIPGWCTLEKARNMMDLIHEVCPTVCVEVGVFGGSSIYPTASALKFLQKGVVYAIDPWKAPDCLVGYTEGSAHYRWWESLNFDDIYLRFLKMLKEYGLRDYCNVLRTTGRAALESFQDDFIDILHIDGNHADEEALADVQMYLPKVKRGGYIWFDDANWPSTQRARDFLAMYCTKDESRSTGEYYLYRKH